MKKSIFVQKMIKDFLMIFASIIIMITVLRQIYYPNMDFDLRSIYIVMAFSFLSVIIGFILHSPHELSEKKLLVRRVIHFFMLEILLTSLCSFFGIVNNVIDAAILVIEIAVVYTVIRLLSWQRDKKEAQKINEKLTKFNKKV